MQVQPMWGWWGWLLGRETLTLQRALKREER